MEESNHNLTIVFTLYVYSLVIIKILNKIRMENSMVRRLKYKIVDGRNHTVHHSYNKQNAKKWLRDFGRETSSYRIKKLRKR